MIAWPLLLLAATRGPVPCTAAVATPTTIETIQRDSSSWLGKCVRLGGMAHGVHLYADRVALLERSGDFGRDARRSILIYPGRHLRSFAEPRWMDIIGRVGSCAAQNAVVHAYNEAHPAALAMLGGYCDTSLETFVAPVSLRRANHDPIFRLTEAEVAPKQRTLVRIAIDGAPIAARIDGARALLRALVDRDRDAFARLVDPETIDGLAQPVTRREDWVNRRIADTERVRAAAAPLRERARPVLANAPALFAQRGDEPDSSDDGDLTRVIACWCTADGCDGRWPVTPIDADNLAGRPYLCVTTDAYGLYPHRRAIKARLPTARAGFAEPGSAIAAAR